MLQTGNGDHIINSVLLLENGQVYKVPAFIKSNHLSADCTSFQFRIKGNYLENYSSHFLSHILIDSFLSMLKSAPLEHTSHKYNGTQFSNLS